MQRPISGTTRSEKNLSWKLDKQLLAYTATAGAAGVAVLALAQCAEAKVVYTAANVPIQLNGGPVYLDLNNDGVADFALQSSTYQAVRIPGKQKHPGLFFQDLEAVPQGAGDAVFGYIDTSQGLDVGCAAALPQGAKVGPKSPFLTSNRAVLFSVVDNYNYGHEACEWAQKHRGAYLGVKFSINGQTHYGWAHITMGSAGTVLNGYAYETVPNQAIDTGKTSGPVATLDSATLPGPQPPTLGMLAQGSRGLSIWRREEEQA
jgi:hypothetical protein